jgi:hypothetical protein
VCAAFSSPAIYSTETTKQHPNEWCSSSSPLSQYQIQPQRQSCGWRSPLFKSKSRARMSASLAEGAYRTLPPSTSTFRSHSFCILHQKRHIEIICVRALCSKNQAMNQLCVWRFLLSCRTVHKGKDNLYMSSALLLLPLCSRNTKSISNNSYVGGEVPFSNPHHMRVCVHQWLRGHINLRPSTSSASSSSSQLSSYLVIKEQGRVLHVSALGTKVIHGPDDVVSALRRLPISSTHIPLFIKNANKENLCLLFLSLRLPHDHTSPSQNSKIAEEELIWEDFRASLSQNGLPTAPCGGVLSLLFPQKIRTAAASHHLLYPFAPKLS